MKLTREAITLRARWRKAQRHKARLFERMIATGHLYAAAHAEEELAYKLCRKAANRPAA